MLSHRVILILLRMQEFLLDRKQLQPKRSELLWVGWARRKKSLMLWQVLVTTKHAEAQANLYSHATGISFQR